MSSSKFFWPILILLFAVPAGLYAQPAANTSALPNAPGVAQAAARRNRTGTGIITGTLKNPQGQPLPNAPLRVFGTALFEAIASSTNAQGVFHISGLPAGTYHVQASARGYLTATSPLVVLGNGEIYRLAITEIALPKYTTTVMVYASTVKIATKQIHQEEKQRVLGIIPNFSTSYQPNPAPLTTKLKFGLTWHILRDPVTIGVSTAVAGMEQKLNIYPGYGSGWEGFGKRAGASYADSVSAHLFGDAIYASLFHQDPRYFYKGTGSFGSRLWYAVRSSFVAKGDNGNWQPAYAALLGDFTAAGISNLYHAPQDRGFGLTMRDGGVIVGGSVMANILREFLSKSLTSNLPHGVKR